MGTVLTNVNCSAGGSCFLFDASELEYERACMGSVLDMMGADSLLNPFALLDGLVVRGIRVASTVETDIELAFALHDGRRLHRPTPMRFRATERGAYYDIESRASISDRRLVVVSSAALPRGAIRLVLDVEHVALGGVDPAVELAMELEQDVVAGCALLDGVAVAVPLVAPLGSWVTDAYVDGARVDVSHSAVVITAAGSAVPALTVFLEPAHVAVPVTLELGTLPSAVSISRSKTFTVVGTPATVAVVGTGAAGAAGAVVELSSPGLAVRRISDQSGLAGLSGLSVLATFEVTPSAVAEYNGTVTVSLGRQALVPCARAYAVTIFGAGSVVPEYVFPSSLAFTAPAAGVFELTPTPMTILATGGTTDITMPARIDVLYSAAEGLVQCGTGTLRAGTAAVTVTLPLGTWAVSFRVTSPYGVQGALVSAGTVTTREHTFPTSASAVLALDGAVTGPDYGVLGFAAGRTYGTASSASSVGSVVTITLGGVDAATQFPREVAATGAVELYVGDAPVVGGIEAYTYDGATHTVTVTSMTLPGSTTGALEFRVTVAAPAGSTRVLATTGHAVYALPTGCTATTLASSVYAVVDGSAVDVTYVLSGAEALARFAPGLSVGAVISEITGPGVSFGAMGAFTAQGAFTLATTYTGATGTTTLTLVVEPTRARVPCVVQGYKFPTTVSFSQPLLTVGTATSITATTDTAIAAGVSWTASASSGTVTPGSGTAASETTHATLTFTPATTAAATGTLTLTLASITRSLSAALPTPIRITHTSIESARMVVGLALPAQTLTLSGPGISALVSADLAVYLNTSNTQVSNCTSVTYDPGTGTATFTVTPSSSGLHALYVKVTGVASAVSYAGSFGQGLFVDGTRGQPYTMPTTFTYTFTTVPVDSVASRIRITTTGASALGAQMRLLYGASSDMADLTKSAGLKQFGSAILADNAASTSSAKLPSGTWYVYARVTSLAGVFGPVLSTAATITCRAYNFPTSFTYTVGTVYATVPTSVAISTAGFDVIGGTVAVYASLNASADPAPSTVCASAALSTTGTATATCVFPAAGTYYLFIKATSPGSVIQTSYVGAAEPVTVVP